MRKSLLYVLLATCLLCALGPARPASGSMAGKTIHLPIVYHRFQLTGAVSGQVTSAATGLPLESIDICLAGTAECTKSAADGKYTLPDVPLGLQTIVATAPTGYFPHEAIVQVQRDQTSTLDLELFSSIAQGDIRIELTWESARDLDAHLWLPPAIPFHVRWNNEGSCTFFPYACLNRDDDAFGPEEIRIKKRFPGNYVYAVYIFGPGKLIDSQPTVRIFDDFGLLAERHIPSEGSGDWWYVFDLDGISGNITPVDIVSGFSPGPYDPAPLGVNQTLSESKTEP